MFHKKEKVFFEHDKKGFIMSKYDIKSYVKEGVASPVEYIIDHHYKINAQALKNLYLPSKEAHKNKESEKLETPVKKPNFEFIKNSRKKEKKALEDHFEMDLLGMDQHAPSLS